MTRIAAAIGLLVAVAAPGAASGQSLLAGVVAGGGRDSNLSGSSGATPVAAGGYATAGVSVGGALEPSRRDELSLEIGWDLTRYPVYPDLDVQRPWVEIAWLHDLGRAITLRIGPAAGLVVAGDRARSGWDVGGTAAARVRLGGGTALRLAAGYRHRDAEDQAFASDSFRAKGGVERDLWRGAAIAATYTVDVGQDTFYAPPQPVATATIAAGAGYGGPGGGGGGGGGLAPGGGYGYQTNTFDSTLIAYSADRVAHTAGLRLTHRFSRGIAVDLSYAYGIVLGAEQDYRSHLAAVELSWRR